MRTILAGGIAVVRSGFVYVEDVAEVKICSFASGVQAEQRVEQKKVQQLTTPRKWLV